MRDFLFAARFVLSLVLASVLFATLCPALLGVSVVEAFDTLFVITAAAPPVGFMLLVLGFLVWLAFVVLILALLEAWADC